MFQKFVLGKTYDEKLAVENSGNIDTFVRVVLTKSWQDKEGKNVDLSPALIELGFNQDGWVINEAQSTDERVVLYYTKVVESKKTTPDFMKTIRISNQLSTMYTKVEDEKTIKKIINENILLEICPTSNVQTNAVKTYENHPIKKLFDLGCKVSINTDNRTVSNVTLTKEYELLNKYLNFSLDEIIKINLETIKHTFLSEKEKQELTSLYLDKIRIK